MIGCLPTQVLAFLAVFVYATHASAQSVVGIWKHSEQPTDIFTDVVTCKLHATRTLCVNEIRGRSHLQSATLGHFDVPRTRTRLGSRAFSVAGPVPQHGTVVCEHPSAEIHWEFQTFKRQLYKRLIYSYAPVWLFYTLSHFYFMHFYF